MNSRRLGAVRRGCGPPNLGRWTQKGANLWTVGCLPAFELDALCDGWSQALDRPRIGLPPRSGPFHPKPRRWWFGNKTAPSLTGPFLFLHGQTRAGSQSSGRHSLSYDPPDSSGGLTGTARTNARRTLGGTVERAVASSPVDGLKPRATSLPLRRPCHPSLWQRREVRLQEVFLPLRSNCCRTS